MTIPPRPAIAAEDRRAESPQAGDSSKQHIPKQRVPKRQIKVDQRQVWLAIATLTLITVLALASPALAHHPFGGATPQSGWTGLLSGLGHPVMGPDHLVFLLVVGLLSALLAHPWQITGAFLLAALAGGGGHLLALDLAAPEFTISLSVLLLGALVARGQHLPMALVLLLTPSQRRWKLRAASLIAFGAGAACLSSVVLG